MGAGVGVGVWLSLPTTIEQNGILLAQMLFLFIRFQMSIFQIIKKEYNLFNKNNKINFCASKIWLLRRPSIPFQSPA